MPLSEFAFIQKFFATASSPRDDVILGIGDDAAILNVPSGKQLIVTTDTLVEGTHFLSTQQSAFDIGYKSLAVNLSDLAAMGATPSWITLAITLPMIDEQWWQEFCRGFFSLSQQYQVQLIGGDTTKGPLSITVQAMGLIDANSALRRDTAEVGDLIYVTGTLGDARVGLDVLLKKNFVNPRAEKFLLQRLNHPPPQIEMGQALVGLAHAAIDISDGLHGDITHILERSNVGATLYVDQLPLSFALAESFPRQQAWEFALSGGDDYELCFTIPAHKQNALDELIKSINCNCTCIGKIEKERGLHLQLSNGEKFISQAKSFQHFN